MIKQLITNGLKEQIKLAEEEEKTKVGYLRAGNTGMINKDGEIIGSCAAEAYLRMLGIPLTKNDINQELMFSSGRGNETLWVDSLKHSWNQPNQGILQEEEIGTSWDTETNQAVKVTGRPDIVLTENNKPVVGIELKQVMSSYTANCVLFKNEPFLKHLMQMTHYMFSLNIPFELWYTNRMKIDLPEYMRFNMPKPGENNSEYLEYNYYKLGNIHPKSGKPIKHKLANKELWLEAVSKKEKTLVEPKKVKPFIMGYQAQLNQAGDLFIKNAQHPKNPWIKTIVNQQDIKRFYNYIAEIKLSGKVPKKYLNLDYLGNELKFSFESPLEELSPEFWAGKNLDKWLIEVKRKFNIKD